VSSSSLREIGVRDKALSSSFSSDAIREHPLKASNGFDNRMRGTFAGALRPSPTTYDLSVKGHGLTDVAVANGASQLAPQYAARAAFSSSQLQRPESRAGSDLCYASQDFSRIANPQFYRPLTPVLGHRPRRTADSGGSEARLVGCVAFSKGQTCGFGKGRAEMPCHFAVPAPQRRAPAPTDRAPSPVSYSLPRFGDQQEVPPRILASLQGVRKAGTVHRPAGFIGSSSRWTFSPPRSPG